MLAGVGDLVEERKRDLGMCITTTADIEASIYVLSNMTLSHDRPGRLTDKGARRHPYTADQRTPRLYRVRLIPNKPA